MSQIFAIDSILDDYGFVSPSPPTEYFISLVKILCSDFFHALAGLNPRKAYGVDGAHPIVLKNYPYVHAPCLAKLSQLCLLTSTFPFSWKFAYTHLVPEKGSRSNPSTATL